MSPYIVDASGRVIALVADNLIPQRAAGPWDQNKAAVKA